MKKKVAFWVVMILANVIIGAISIRTYQKLEVRVSGVENNQKNYNADLKNYNDKLSELALAHKKTFAELLKTLGVDGKYDFNNNLVKIWDLDKFFNYHVYVRTSVTLEIPEGLRKSDSGSKKDFAKVGEAPAVIIGRYVLMASHTNDAEIFSRQTISMNTPIGTIEHVLEFKVLGYNVTLIAADKSEHSLKELYRNKEKDFSLFEILTQQNGKSKNVKIQNFPFEIGKSNQLRIGHFLYMNGRPIIYSEVARPGYVTSLVNAFLSGTSEVREVKKDDGVFGLSQSTDNGDSGSPVVAFRDGNPELVGIYLGWSGSMSDNGNNTRSRALKIDIVVDEIKEKLKVDLREIQHKILYNTSTEN
ncbi:MAG: serine protease [Patescibacteria group bacterium]